MLSLNKVTHPSLEALVKTIGTLLGVCLSIASFAFALSPFWSRHLSGYLHELRYADGAVDWSGILAAGIAFAGIILMVVGIVIVAWANSPKGASEEK